MENSGSSLPSADAPRPDERLITSQDGRTLRTWVRAPGTEPDNVLVVFEAGLGASGRYWAPVQNEVSSFATAVAYDRAGYGKSEPDPLPRTLDRLAGDLNTVVESVPHRHLVLVGHSWGGPIVRRLAQQRSARGAAPAGMVLVDQSDENAQIYFGRASRISNRLQMLLMPALARTGLLRNSVGRLVSQLPEPIRTETVRSSTTCDAARAAVEETRHLVKGLDDMRSGAGEPADVPVRVLSGQRTTALDRTIRRSLTDAHRTTAAQYAQGLFIPAHRSGHMIHLDEPELVINTIRDLVLSLPGSQHG